MKLSITLLFCLVLLSVVLAKKPSKPSKPSKPGKGKPSKPAKPTPEKPTATERPPKPVEAEVESLNEMFDQKAFDSMPGCLPCMKSTWMLDCITTCYDSKDYAPEKCLVCLLEKAPMCVAPCGFTNLASIGAWPAPSHGGVTDCIQQGQGILMKDGSKMEDTNIVDQMIPGVHSAYECGMKCLDSARFTYYNEWAARSEDRYNCYCLNAYSDMAEIMPRFDMDSGFENCPVTLAPTLAREEPVKMG